jgi:hypothetical protein
MAAGLKPALPFIFADCAQGGTGTLSQSHSQAGFADFGGIQQLAGGVGLDDPPALDNVPAMGDFQRSLDHLLDKEDGCPGAVYGDDGLHHLFDFS